MSITPEIHKSIIIRNINVITMLDERILKGYDIHIKEGRIKKIEKKIPLPKESFIIEGSGKYIMPGLIDMHVHLGLDWDDLTLYLLNGVTTIRNMAGLDEPPFVSRLTGSGRFYHNKLRDAINKGVVEGPRIFNGSRMVNALSVPGYGHLFYKIKNQTQAVNLVCKIKEKGDDFLKFYGDLSEELFNIIAEECQRLSLPMAGHVPKKMSLKKVLNTPGVVSIEHLLGFFNPYLPEQAPSREEYGDMAQLAAERSVWNCPTLCTWERVYGDIKKADWQNNEEMAYIPDNIMKKMKFAHRILNFVSKKLQVPRTAQDYEKLYVIMNELSNAGAGLVLGTDSGNPYLVPGFALYREIEYFLKAGLSNYETLKAGTLNAAKALGRDKDFGTLQQGLSADMIILKDNPLENPGTLQDHHGVMYQGKWLSPDYCKTLKQELRGRR